MVFSGAFATSHPKFVEIGVAAAFSAPYPRPPNSKHGDADFSGSFAASYPRSPVDFSGAFPASYPRLPLRPPRGGTGRPISPEDNNTAHFQTTAQFRTPTDQCRLLN